MTKKSNSAARATHEANGTDNATAQPEAQNQNPETPENPEAAKVVPLFDLQARLSKRMEEVKRLMGIVTRLEELREKADNFRQAFNELDPDDCHIRLNNGTITMTSHDPAAFRRFCEIQMDAYQEQISDLETALSF